MVTLVVPVSTNQLCPVLFPLVLIFSMIILFFDVDLMRLGFVILPDKITIPVLVNAVQFCKVIGEVRSYVHASKT
jgi:hypothetical protein